MCHGSAEYCLRDATKSLLPQGQVGKTARRNKTVRMKTKCQCRCEEPSEE